MNYDGKINLIAFLMTTLFVYNSFGQLDEFLFKFKGFHYKMYAK